MLRDPRRCKILEMSSQLIPSMFTPGRRSYEAIKDALPTDVNVVWIQFDGFLGRVAFLVQSPSFDAVPMDEPWPRIEPVIRAYAEPERSLVFSDN